MTNSGNSGDLKRNISKIIEKLKGARQYKILILSITMCLLLFTVIFAYYNKSEKPLTSTLKIESISLEDNTSDNKSAMKLEKGLEEIADAKNDINEILQVKTPLHAVNVAGNNLVTFKTKDEAEKLLDDIIKPFTEGEEVEIKDVKFKEDVKIVEKLEGIDESLENREYEEILHYITKGTNETKIHKVEKGENYWVIAEKYNITPDGLIKANPGVKPERLQIGQEISLIIPKPLITVVTTEEKEYKEYIAFDTKYEETNVLYKGEYRVKKAGKKGEREVKAEIAKENGIETSREILEEKIIMEPTTKLVLKGTKNPPPRIGTGKFAKPTSRGVISSPFGLRWGRRHTGIDIALPTGTPVKAADGGKVIYSGYKGAYGKCVIIDHGENKQTLYAHNSKLLVKKGDKVFKGQTITHSGNTGRSTGPHLHFEVRINGTPVNPSKYVKY